MPNIIQRLEDRLFKNKTMENVTQAQQPVSPAQPAAPVVGPTVNTPDVEQPGTNPEAVDQTPPAAPEPEVQPEPEPAQPAAEDRAAFNCPDCQGEGLQDQYNVCPRCNGTGKV